MSQKKSQVMKELAPFMNMGIQLAVTMGVFGVIGFYADEHFETKPVLLVVGLLFGATGGMVGVFREVQKLKK